MNKTIYLDAAASSLKPQSVIDAQREFLTDRYANAGRGVCARAMAADDMVDRARGRVAEFVNAPGSDNIVFTSGTTDGMNRIARILDLSSAIKEYSRIIVSDLDHHSARLPWEQMARLGKCSIDRCELDENLNLDFRAGKKADVLVITAMSNVLGRPQDVAALIRTAKTANPNVIAIVDAAQYAAHFPINVPEWDCDFLCFSAHKIGADTGLGLMYVKEPDRWQVDKMGGGMASKVEGGVWVLADGSARYEAGTLPLTQIAGLAPALDYLESHRPNQELIKCLHSELSKISGIKIFTEPGDALLTFVAKGMHCIDFGSLAGAHGLCLRVGNMCASWIHARLKCAGSIRISTGPWNTMDEMNEVAGIIKKIMEEI
ncbi:MAG: aminotransferase class V-fold PLP-dependent enzyme [Rickettsiales bacterium]|jgi:cysteine desulfurase/selenocysteine lyase|nr:aminotransferase class V-fold PLP-dependent enzyme [Rickettsiales bacterium]